jgi:hypothetical protein
MIMNRKGFGRKQLWRNRGNMGGYFLEVLSKTMKYLSGWLVSRTKFALITSRIWVSGVTDAWTPSVRCVDDNSKGTLPEYMEIALVLCKQSVTASVNNIQTNAIFELALRKWQFFTVGTMNCESLPIPIRVSQSVIEVSVAEQENTGTYQQMCTYGQMEAVQQ